TKPIYSSYVLCCSLLYDQDTSFFFFSSRRRHTRFSRDWSSDVCSSDLDLLRVQAAGSGGCRATDQRGEASRTVSAPDGALSGARSEERRVGKECRSRWGPCP